MRWGLAAESQNDARLISDLVDRILVATVDWIASETIGSFRSWSGAGDDEWLDLHRATELARSRRLPLYGHFRGERGALDAQLFRAALLLFADQEDRPALVVVSRDLDGKQERSLGLEQAITDRKWPFETAGALAQPEIEAWLIAAWSPDDDAERTRLASLRKDLGFDPTRQSERLASTAKGSAKDAKRVLKQLTRTGRSAKERWAAVPIDEWTQRGSKNGVAAFVARVREVLPRLASNYKR